MASTTSDTSLLEQANGPKLAAKKEKPNGSVKLKKVIAKNTKPKDGEGSGMLRLDHSMNEGNLYLTLK